MTERHDEGSGGNGFTMGLVVGVTLGVVAGVLFAPKPGWEMRRTLAEGAGDLGEAAKDRWEDLAEGVSSAVDKGRETYNQAVGTVADAAASARTSADSAKEPVRKDARSEDSTSRTGASTRFPKSPGENR